jgi:hypothetical protein
MLKQIIVAGALAVFSIGPAGAQSFDTRQSPGISTTPGPVAAVQACVVQMHRMAGLDKGLAANYNAERVHNECMTSTREAVASK